MASYFDPPDKTQSVNKRYKPNLQEINEELNALPWEPPLTAEEPENETRTAL